VCGTPQPGGQPCRLQSIGNRFDSVSGQRLKKRCEDLRITISAKPVAGVRKKTAPGARASEASDAEP